MKLKTLLVTAAAVAAFGAVDALAGGHMGPGGKGRHSKHGKPHGKKHDGASVKDGAGASSSLWKSGFTAGVTAGWEGFNPKKATVSEVPDVGPARTPSKLQTKNASGFVGGVFVGYNHFIKNILVGVVTGGEFGTAKSKKTTAIPALPATASASDRRVITKISKRWSWLLHAKFGMAAGKFLPYVKLGTAYNGYRANANSSLNFAGAATVPFNVTYKKSAWAFAPAIGVDFAVNKNISVGAEAMYQTGGKVKTKTKPIVAGSRANARIKPQIWSVKAGVAYRM